MAQLKSQNVRADRRPTVTQNKNHGYETIETNASLMDGHCTRALLSTIYFRMTFRLSVIFPVMVFFMLFSNIFVILMAPPAMKDNHVVSSQVMGDTQAQQMNGNKKRKDHLVQGIPREPRLQAQNESLGSSQRRHPPQANNSYNRTTRIQLASRSLFPSLKRFPDFGTEEFHRECSWLPIHESNHIFNNCTLLAKLYSKGNEGVSDFWNKVIETHQLAVQANCRLLVDYGVDGIDIHQVFSSPSTQNWTVPHGYDCTSDPMCFQARSMYSIQSQLEQISNATGTKILRVPQYRMAYVGRDHPQHFFQNSYLELRKRLPGLWLETSFACSFASLFKLAPMASKYEPTLFTKILPALHQEDALVICLYVRTGRTDILARDEDKHTKNVDSNYTLYEQRAGSVISCAKHLEQEYLTSNNTKYTKAIWLVITDAPYLKNFIPTHYSNPSRTIIITASRGVHSRPLRGPSMQDVAEALLDWYLIGESTVVIQYGSVSYGETASLRTSRPIYHKCERIQLIHNRKG